MYLTVKQGSYPPDSKCQRLFKAFFRALVCAVLLFGASSAVAQNVSGTVLDENDEPLIGASVCVSGDKTGVTTDLDGNFTLANAL